MMRARRLSYLSSLNPKIEDCKLPQLRESDLLVRALFSGISRGTEGLVYNGRVPRSEHQSMRCPHQHGEFTFPISYGYANVGCVEQVGKSVSGFEIGDLVFALHPHQDLYVADSTFCSKLPDGMSPAVSVLSANMETALNAVWDAELPMDGSFSVIGAGVVGLLTGFLIKSLSNITPTIIDINPTKQNISEQLGLNFVNAREQLPPQNRIFNTSASGKGLQAALDIAAFEAKIIEMSWYGEKEVTLSLGRSFHSKRLQIISSQVGHISPTKRAKISHTDRMQLAMQYLQDPVLANLLEPAIDFEDLPPHLHGIFSDNSDALCQLVRYKAEI